MKSIRRSHLIVGFVLACSSALLADSSGSFTKTLQVSGTPDVEISTGSGDITVHTGGGTSITVNARIRVSDQWFGGGNLSADEKVKRLENNPPVTQNGSMVSIGRITDPELRRNVSISYDVTLPAASRVRSESGSGNVSIDGVNGYVKMNSGSGNITAKHLGDELRISTGSGDIRIDTAKGPVRVNAGSGTIEASGIGGAFYSETGSGDITLRQDAPGMVTAKTGSGNVRLRNVNGGLEAHSGSGDIEIDGQAKKDWTVESGSGNIDLKLPSNAAFSVDARASSGSVAVNHPITMQGTLKKNHIQGRVGEGGPMLNLQSGSGEIRVN
jgi:DUF4097 and DUF4098 domain-containing protein YvlB